MIDLSALGWLLAPFAIAVAAMAAYLGMLSVAAFVNRPAVPPPGPRTRRFAVLVPAHDEAAVIERLLRSLALLRYPRDFVDVFVVADNCVDTTAELARRAGAIVHERKDATLKAKGHALRWLFERVRARGPYDAYVIFDADSEVASDFLERMDARLTAGALVVQSHYRVLNAEASSVAALREAALASLHYLRPLGRAALGLSCGLKGNGMCFDARTLDRHGWSSVGLAEDVELHLELVRHGVRVDFAPEAVVRADMPLTLEAASSQNLRWEAGRLATIRHLVLPLLGTGIVRFDLKLVDAAAEQLIPPLSVAVSVGAACAFFGALAGNATVTTLGLVGTSGLVLHVLAGLLAVRAPVSVYRALLATPAYIGWKLLLYARATAAGPQQAWVRTERSKGPNAQAHR